MKDALLKILRLINFTAIFKSIVSSIGGPLGWLVSIFGGGIVQSAENAADKKIDSTIATDESDKKLETQQAEHTNAMDKAQTSDEIDKAARDIES